MSTRINVKNEGDNSHSDCSDIHSDQSGAHGHLQHIEDTKNFYKNIKGNQFIILPDKKQMKEVMKLGMP